MATVRGPDDQDLDGLITRFEALVARVLRRIVRRVARGLDNDAGPAAVSPDDAAVVKVLWAQHLDAEVAPALAVVHRRAAAAMAVQLAEVGHDLPAMAGQTTDEYLAQARNRLVGIGDTVWESVRDQLAAGVQAGEGIPELAARVQNAAGVSEARARVIARTEVVGASNAATLAQAMLLDDPTVTKTWLATPGPDGSGCDDATRPTHCAANGQQAPIGDPFTVGGAPLMFPGDPTGPAYEVIQCRCSFAVDVDGGPVMSSAPGSPRPWWKRGRAEPDGRRSAGVSQTQAETPSAAQVQKQKLANAKRRRKNLPAGVDPARDIIAAAGADEARVMQAMRAAYDYTDPGTGLRATVTDLDVPPGERLARTFFDIEDESGQQVGFGSRVWSVKDDGSIIVLHEGLEMSPTVQGGGFATRFNEQAEDIYRDTGIRDVRLHANMDVGGYAWAVRGYNFLNMRSMLDISGRAWNLLRSGEPPFDDPQVREQVNDLIARSTPVRFQAQTHATPYEWAMLGRNQAQVVVEDGRERLMWPGKQLMLGSKWDGWKDLAAHPVTSAVELADRKSMLEDAASTSVAYADLVADQVPAVPGDASPNEQGKTDYAEHHHLISAPPKVDLVLLDSADAVLNHAAAVVDQDAEERGLVVAATQAHNGAMVALIPSAQDATRIAVAGGEPADQLHLTLAYLGPAADIPAEVRERIVSRLIALVDDAVDADYKTPVLADGFAVSVFNPGDANDRDTCLVLGVSGDAVDAVHNMVEDALGEAVADTGYALPPQHAPFVPHITLVYTDDLSIVEQLVDRVGPVRFDRLRVAFAGVNVDIPLELPASEADSELDALQRDRPLRNYWIHGPGALKIRWGTDGDFTRCVRHLREHVRDPEGLCAEYHKEATGKWPGEKDHADGGETTMTTADTQQPLADDGCPPGQHSMPNGQCMPDGEMGEQLTAQPGEHFHTVVMEGVSTGMRQFAPGAISWREPPFAFHWQRSSSAHAGTPETVQIGLVTRAVRDGDTVHFFGPLDLRSPEGLDYARRLVDGFARWTSVGADESFRDSDVELVWEFDWDDDLEEVAEREPDQAIMRRFRVAEVSGVSVPALADATVEPTQELLDALAKMGIKPQPLAEVEVVPVGDAPVAAAALDTFGAVAAHKTGTSDESWDADANVKRLPSPIGLATARSVFAEIDESRAEDGMVPKDACKFPHHNVSADGTPGAANLDGCSTAIAMIHGARSGQRTGSRGVYDHVRAHLIDGGRDPDSIPAFEAAAPVTAAGYTVTIPDLPPAEWFEEPAASPYGELRVEESGRIHGFLAPRGVAHRSFRQRLEVPMGRVDYSGWMNKPWPVADGGRIYVGVLTMDCGHASTDPADWSYVHRREHYDNSCSVAAHARIGENRHGVWIAGALAPWLDAERLGKMMSCQLSGDWDSHKDRPGWRDFVAALLVPVEGFPKRVPTASVRVTDGALVASTVPVRFVHTGHHDKDMRPVLERIARSIRRDTASRLAALHARVHRDQ